MSITNEAIIEHLAMGKDLDAFMMRELMERILSCSMPPTQIAASLALLRAKKASALEIATAVETVIQKSMPIETPEYLYADVVGTGGDGHNTINVSTLASLTAAALGMPVAKHGSSSVSSRCGSADLLEELGIDISLSPEAARRSLDEQSWCFLWAPLYNPAFKSIKGLRQELRIRTIFNILGPLVNPIAPPIMLVGVYDPGLIMPMVNALKNLQRTRVLVVHGSGLDEIAVHGPTRAAFLHDQQVEELTLTTKDLGLKTFDLDDIKGGSPKENASLCENILGGRSDEAKTAAVAASAGAVLWISEKALSLKEGVRMASDALHAGKPLQKLISLREYGHGAR
jgi:anthranilate phosphoribosyltransferase